MYDIIFTWLIWINEWKEPLLKQAIFFVCDIGIQISC